ncbi:adenine glycosylase [Paenibacillus swuensis]|uniref:Adenine DNA glycosylase n=1 Tax=Paenibacillus swuensis TaxID=1178515 RepID=A0A172TNR5_9BACL|nr:A/G-specific adenine glycosylase [Paenibacillus swuensis]ANE48678.1 adenine glycosylase [Paenibacillus swuensis]
MDLAQRQRFFSTNLLAWYDVHKRDLPWRRNKNPYYIWISEIMLQQTRVDTVIPYWHRFIEKFPTIEALADAPEDEVLKAWEGLGYYSRARNLQSAVREVMETYGGIVPDTKPEISGLKGVGPYTAGAILSIAYNKPEPAVDGNVMRVLSRYFLIEEDIMKGSTRAYMESLIYQLIPEGRAGDFNQALMELGAMVCTPKSPHCLTCPVMEQCAGRLEGMEESLPVKTKAKPPRPEHRLAAVIAGTGERAGQFLIRRRPDTGLLARMWELPHVAAPEPGMAFAEGGEAAGEALRAGLAAEAGLDIQPLRWLMLAEHTFSHIHWNMGVYVCELAPGPDAAAAGAGDSGPPPGCAWVDAASWREYAFPNVFLRIVKEYLK